jgi:hypothetical protein
MTVLSWIATALVVLLVCTFVIYVLSLRHLPLEITHELPTYDRYGRAEYAPQREE